VFYFYQINKNNKIKTRNPVIKTLISGYIKKLTLKQDLNLYYFLIKGKTTKKDLFKAEKRKGPRSQSTSGPLNIKLKTRTHHNHSPQHEQDLILKALNANCRRREGSSFSILPGLLDLLRQGLATYEDRKHL
jgi:hypothetical protein